MNLQTGLFFDQANEVKGKRVGNDFYPTPAPLTKILLAKAPNIPSLCFEPCAGHGAISDVLRASDRMVQASDIQWGFDYPQDATTREFWEYWANSLRNAQSIDCRNWATVTNPPFNVASSIIPLAYEYSPWGIAFLLRLSYLEPTGDRAEWLQLHADSLRYLIPVNPRPKFRKASGTDSCTVAWFVWDKSWSWKAHGI
ncbi:MAG: hypothetical protein ACRC62_30030, partial [Microcoleus sp.]